MSYLALKSVVTCGFLSLTNRVSGHMWLLATHSLSQQPEKVKTQVTGTRQCQLTYMQTAPTCQWSIYAETLTVQV